MMIVTPTSHPEPLVELGAENATTVSLAQEFVSHSSSTVQAEPKLATSPRPVRAAWLLFLGVIATACAAMLMTAVFPSTLKYLPEQGTLRDSLLGISQYIKGEPKGGIRGETKAGMDAERALATLSVDRSDPARSEKIDVSQELKQLATFVSKKYSVAPSQIQAYIKIVQHWAAEYGLDPMLILGVMSIESNFNPIVQSTMGAQGLMQVLTRVHTDKLQAYGGDAKVFDPEVNIAVGSRILRDCLKLGGSDEAGLKCYVGASGPTDGGYGAKVLAERARLIKATKGQYDFTPNNKVLLDLASASVSAPIKLEVSSSMASPADGNTNLSLNATGASANSTNTSASAGLNSWSQNQSNSGLINNNSAAAQSKSAINSNVSVESDKMSKNE